MSLLLDATLLRRFNSKWISTPDGCWRWTDVLVANGYGYLGIGGRSGRKVQAHRLAYELFIGPIPDGLEIDHLCRNRWCVNPDHLEAVTRRTNLLRGNGQSAVNFRKTKCSRGHPLSGPKADVLIDYLGRRVCRVCRRQNDKKRRSKCC